MIGCEWNGLNADNINVDYLSKGSCLLKVKFDLHGYIFKNCDVNFYISRSFNS